MQYFIVFKACKALSYWVFFVLFYLFFSACPKKPKTQLNPLGWAFKKNPGFFEPCKQQQQPQWCLWHCYQSSHCDSNLISFNQCRTLAASETNKNEQARIMFTRTISICYYSVLILKGTDTVQHKGVFNGWVSLGGRDYGLAAYSAFQSH